MFSRGGYGTPSNGVGTSIDFEGRNSTFGNKLYAQISAKYSNVTAGSESGQFDFSLMNAGAAEVTKMSLKSTGQLHFPIWEHL